MEYSCTLKEPGVSISLRISRELWGRVQKFVEDETFPDFSHASRDFIDVGLWFLENKQRLQDPKQVNQLVVDWKSKMNEKGILEWPKKLTDSQIQAAQDSLEMEKQRRNKF